MELNHLKYFYEVAKAGSFTKASKALRVSQPSISKIIKQLEEQQNVRLFDRGKKGVLLTDAGKRAYDSCSVIFGEVTNLKTSIVHLRETCAGDLSIGASDNLCNYALPEMFFEFWKKYPAVRIHLFSGTSEAIKSELRENRVELGLYYDHGYEPVYEAEPISFVEFALVCSSENKLLQKANLKELPRLLNEAFYLGSRIADYSKPYPALKMLQEIGVKPKLFFETNNQETQKKMAIQKYGYTLIPRFMVKDELKSGKLIELKTPKKLGAQLYLVQKKEKALSRPALVFKEYLLKRISSAQQL